MSIIFSIISATLNRRQMLDRALKSVERQNFDNVQHIIVDGGSTDGTLEMLYNWPDLEIISESDRNLYEAWNKGIQRAKGDYIVILNSDDELPDSALQHAANILSQNNMPDLISGAVEISRSNSYGQQDLRLISNAAMITLRENDVIAGIPLTNARFLSREFLNRVGPFDERYSIISDRQFFLRALMHSPSSVTTSSALYRYHIHDDSLTLNDLNPSLEIGKQCVEAALHGMVESKDQATQQAFRRWHAWANFYLSGQQFRQGEIRNALATGVQALGRDILLPFRLPKMITTHWKERQARLGEPI